MAWMADDGPAMLVVPVSIAAVAPLPSDMEVPWTVKAVRSYITSSIVVVRIQKRETYR